MLVGQAAHSVIHIRRNNHSRVLLTDSRRASHMIKENQKTKDSNLFGKKFEDNLMKKLNQGRNRKIQFNFHLLNPKECRFKGALIQLPWQRRSNASEAFITTSSHRGQNQVRVSPSITKEPSFSNSKNSPSQKQGQ